MHARSGGLHHLCQATAFHRVQVCYLALADQADPTEPQDISRHRHLKRRKLEPKWLQRNWDLPIRRIRRIRGIRFRKR